MNSFARKNIVFVCLFFFIFIFIGIFNFLVDPYNVFSKNVNDVSFNDLPRNLFLPFYKLHKKDECDVLVVGGSDSTAMLGPRNSSRIQYINYDLPLNWDDLLASYLEIHPEVKHVVLVFSTVFPFHFSEKADYLYSNNNPTFGFEDKSNFDLYDLFLLLYSKEVIFQSFMKFTQTIFAEKNVNSYENVIRTKPNYFIWFCGTDDFNSYISKDEYFSLVTNIEKILKAKGIKSTVVLSPVNAIYHSVVYKNNKEIYNSICDMKRLLVDKFSFVYDFSYVTESSSVSLFDKENFYWRDFIHFTEEYGSKYKDIILESKLTDDVSYQILTKENIEAKLDIQEILLLDYIKNNDEQISYYTKIAYGNLEGIDINYTITKKLEN